MKLNAPKKRREILSFRTDSDLKKKVDLAAKKRKVTRAEFLETLVAETVLNQTMQPRV